MRSTGKKAMMGRKNKYNVVQRKCVYYMEWCGSVVPGWGKTCSGTGDRYKRAGTNEVSFQGSPELEVFPSSSAGEVFKFQGY